jgi:CheY-like chemotaxis protein
VERVHHFALCGVISGDVNIFRCEAVSMSAPSPSTSPFRKRVLIIEDDLTHASALRSILTRKGCDVAAAATLADGVAMLASRPDFIVLDLMLPDGDGVEVLKRVRELDGADPGAGAPRVIVTTAVSDAEKIREVLALQPHRLLRKPIDLVDLLGAIGMM